jgi:alkylhydroperoxidase family enzyme
VVLGRSAGLDEEKLRHIGDDPLPDGIYADDERAIVEYAQRSTRLDPITDELYGRLSAHFTTQQIIEICFTVGLSNIINRFHATFLTDVDPETGEVVGPTCPMPMPAELQARAEQGWDRSSDVDG